jgi:hypothetical protein
MRRGVVCGLLAVVFAAGIGQANSYDGRLLSLKDLKAEAKQNEALDAYMMRNGLPDVAESRALADRPPWDDHEVTLYYLGTRKEISFARASVLSRTDIAVEHYERDLSDADVAALMGVLQTAEIEPDRDHPVKPASDVEAVANAEAPAAADAAPTTADAAPADVQPVANVDTTEVASLDQAPMDDLAGIDASDPTSRAEAAAIRAEQAADRVEVAADKAETAALRAEKAFDRLAAAYEAKRAR